MAKGPKLEKWEIDHINKPDDQICYCMFCMGRTFSEIQRHVKPYPRDNQPTKGRE